MKKNAQSGKPKAESGKRRSGGERPVVSLLQSASLIAGSVRVIPPERGRGAFCGKDPRCLVRFPLSAFCFPLFTFLLGLMVFTATACKPVDGPPSRGQSSRGQSSNMPALETITTETGFEMVSIPAGRFTMGRSGGEPDEGPPHEVSVDALLMDRYEVTQAQWDKLVLGNPSHFKGPKRPVEMISWAAAALFCNDRSRAEGLQPCYDEETAECNFDASGYRLPTEAEWEYACRAGSAADYDFGPEPGRLKDHAWHKPNAAQKTQPVGQKKPNAWGLFDMHGNVAEWCNDVYDAAYYRSGPSENPRGPAEGEKYVLRGGAWNCSAEACRSSYRVGEDPGFQDACFAQDATGFRCMRKAPAPEAKEETEDD